MRNSDAFKEVSWTPATSLGILQEFSSAKDKNAERLEAPIGMEWAPIGMEWASNEQLRLQSGRDAGVEARARDAEERALSAASLGVRPPHAARQGKRAV